MKANLVYNIWVLTKTTYSMTHTKKTHCDYLVTVILKLKKKHGTCR